MKNEPVSTYDFKEQNQTIIEQQDEILFENNLYRAPDINFLSKPELNKGNSVNQEELELNAEKLKIFEDKIITSNFGQPLEKTFEEYAGTEE